MANWMEKRAKNLEAIKTLRFGVEIETAGLSKVACARAIQSVVGGRAIGSYETSVVDAEGRTWKATHDGSIQSPNGESAEIVTPPLTYADMEKLQDVVRALRTAGATINASCGLHVHVDGASLSPADIARLARLVYRQEEFIAKGLGVLAARRSQWCKALSADFAERLASRRPQTREEIGRLWYDTPRGDFSGRAATHRDYSRYSGLNLHSLFFRGTVEFRWFNSTLHAGEVRAFVVLCLALVAESKHARAVAARDTSMTPWHFVRWLRRIAFGATEFRAVRSHVVKGFDAASLARPARGARARRAAAAAAAAPASEPSGSTTPATTPAPANGVPEVGARLSLRHADRVPLEVVVVERVSSCELVLRPVYGPTDTGEAFTIRRETSWASWWLDELAAHFESTQALRLCPSAEA